MMRIAKITSKEDKLSFQAKQESLFSLTDLEQKVREIVEQVKENKDAALFEFTEKFDHVALSPATVRVQEEEFAAAYKAVDEEFLAAIRLAKERISSFHAKQKKNSWLETNEDGTILGQVYRPLDSCGLYVPGGTAAYPSSVMMNALPAKVAGVERIVMVSPPGREGKMNPHVLVAAKEAGVTEVYKVGGAQAIAALAFGTESLPKVDKIVGPGNIYVTLAKKLVYGAVNLDMLAGPSEVLVIADEQADPELMAADLLSQAEHDVLASAILITPSEKLAYAVQQEVEKQLAVLPRKEIAGQSIANRGLILIVRDLEEAIEMANFYAPEHLEVAVDNPWQYLGKIKHAGAIFLGSYSPEPLGDYLAGPNHVLPTGGTARFFSPLNVDDFMKKSSVLSFTQEGLNKVGSQAVKLATVEGLTAHAHSVELRMK
ncbi:MAG: histidinol dehydrogenase [bacterium]